MGCNQNCCSTASKRYCIFGTAVFCLLFALVVTLLWPQLSPRLLADHLVLKEGSVNYENWIETPLPMYFDIYLFNWTNPEEVTDATKKPNFVEMGPYVFQSSNRRVQLDWHDENNTISFNQIRTWHFVPELSNGTLSDEITNLNVISATVAYTMRHSTTIMKMVVNYMLNHQGGSMAVTKPAGEWIFDGYDDPLLDFIKKANVSMNIPFKKFGWFVERNGSAEYDGRFNMFTGADDINKLGMLDLWNGNNVTQFYSGRCSEVRGTTGELWPPAQHPKGPISFFVTDFCRTIGLEYDSPYASHGIDGSKWIGTDRMFDNGEKYPENSCYCTGAPESCPDLLPGVMNVSDCRFGAPAFLSYPHFYLGDEHYRDAVSGMEPNKENHQFFMAMEPFTGIPLQIDARLQINMLLEPVSHLDLYSNIPHKMMLPMFWFSQHAEITAAIASEARMAMLLRDAGSYMGIAFGSLGLLIILVTLSVFLYRVLKSNRDDEEELLR